MRGGPGPVDRAPPVPGRARIAGKCVLQAAGGVAGDAVQLQERLDGRGRSTPGRVVFLHKHTDLAGGHRVTAKACLKRVAAPYAGGDPRRGGAVYLVALHKRTVLRTSAGLDAVVLRVLYPVVS